MRSDTFLYIAPALAVGGAEKFLASLSNAAYSHDNPRKQILVSLSDLNPLQSEFDKKIDFHCFPRKSKFDVKPVLKLRSLVKQEKPGIIICLNFFSYFILRCALMGMKKNTHRIISYHSTIHPNWKEDFLHSLYAKLITKKDLIITVCNNQAQYTSKRYHISSDLFKTIYNGIDTSLWKLPPPDWNKNSVRKEYNIPADAKVIIITATFRPEKNHMGAVRALQILHKKFDFKAYLLLVGDGYLVNDVKQLAKTLGLEDFVKFTGVQYDVRPFYWASDIFTLCSNSVETFSIAALEAMSCGLPSVLTDIGGANEMIVEGKNGFLTKPDENEIAAAWKKALAYDFSSVEINGYINQHFYRQKMIEEYQEIFEKVSKQDI